jgi:hypothetical protein
MAVKKLPLGSLVMDYALYPRSQVSSVHAGQLAEAVRAGETLPPLVIESGTHRVVDGFHRVHAYRQLLKPNEKVRVEERTYADEGELVRDAIRMNSHHGRPLGPYDQARSIAIAQEHGVGLVDVAADLGVTVEKVKSLTDTRVAVGPQKEKVVLKSSIAPFMRGKTLTGAQVKANERLDGMRPLYHVSQLSMLLKNDLIDYGSETVVGALHDLASLIDEKVPVIESEEVAS